jgi:hypothetical protein
MRLRRVVEWSAICLFAVSFAACAQQSPGPAAQPAPEAAKAPAPSPIDRGQLLVMFGGCHDCHSPKKLGPNGPELDTDRLLSGHPESLKVAAPFKPAGGGSPWTAATNDMLTAWSGPWGVSFAANLTPDTNTGLRSGVWTEELFIKAIRTGKHMGTSRDILPPMPWQDVKALSDEDLKAIWAYLGTIPAINNHVPDPIPPAGTPGK